MSEWRTCVYSHKTEQAATVYWHLTSERRKSRKNKFNSPCRAKVPKFTEACPTPCQLPAALVLLSCVTWSLWSCPAAEVLWDGPQVGKHKLGHGQGKRLQFPSNQIRGCGWKVTSLCQDGDQIIPYVWRLSALGTSSPLEPVFPLIPAGSRRVQLYLHPFPCVLLKRRQVVRRKESSGPTPPWRSTLAHTEMPRDVSRYTASCFPLIFLQSTRMHYLLLVTISMSPLFKMLIVCKICSV